MLALMREAAIKLLNTLSHKDYFYILLMDGTDFNDNFIPTNESNREQLEQFIITSTDQPLTATSNIVLQLTVAYKLFRY